MHQALQIGEIRSIVCGFAHDRCKGDALRLGLTCHVFLEPALNLLWHEVHDFTKLLRCFPSDIWTEERHERGYNQTTLKSIRFPTGQDWARPLYYAKRIRLLTFEDNFNTRDVQASFYTTLAITCPDNAPFRRLQRLQLFRYRPEHASMMFFYRLLLSASVQQLEVHFQQWETPEQAMFFVNLAVSRCTPTHVDLECANLSDSALDHIISEWSQLQSLSLGAVSTKTMQQIAVLPALRVFKVDTCDKSAIHGNMLDVKGHDTFPVLQRLIVRNSTIEACTWLLNLMDRSPVQKLDMHFSSTASAAEWRHLIECLPDAVDNQTLERLVLFDDTWPRETMRDIVTSAMVGPLLCFHELRHLTIRPRCPVHLDGAMIMDVAKALARLCWLDMRGWQCTDEGPTSALTMNDLVTFALQCPALQAVGLSVDDLRQVPWTQPGHLPEDGRCNPSVTMMMIGDATIADKDSIVFASYLSFVFPNLHSIEPYYWNRVTELLPLCRTLRQQGYLHGLRQEGREGSAAVGFGHQGGLSRGWAPEPEEEPEDSDRQYVNDSP